MAKNNKVKEQIKLKGILNSLHTAMVKAVEDKHDIESTQEALLQKYKKGYPKYANLIQTYWDNISVKTLLMQVENIKPKKDEPKA